MKCFNNFVNFLKIFLKISLIFRKQKQNKTKTNKTKTNKKKILGVQTQSFIIHVFDLYTTLFQKIFPFYILIYSFVWFCEGLMDHSRAPAACARGALS